ncbi:uncharacterized protein LOC110117896 isoform X2 [Ceratitis capitata]|nr:uncharacterized protein LOC110117896 isoform X2 [Ceratitis capitata]XP_020713641.1 uncharacterized protein LOC110117896 isoform X2 [Ceratitis capitata]
MKKGFDFANRKRNKCSLFKRIVFLGNITKYTYKREGGTTSLKRYSSSTKNHQGANRIPPKDEEAGFRDEITCFMCSTKQNIECFEIVTKVAAGFTESESKAVTKVKSKAKRKCYAKNYKNHALLFVGTFKPLWELEQP